MRKARDVPGYAALLDTTSFLPFAAILTGRQRLVAGELPLLGLAVGIGLTIVLGTYHATLFGP